MNGAVITGTPIAVDYWRCQKSPGSKIFFLSHAHSDHTSGLSSTWRYPIYCSEITGKVVVAKCGVKQSLIKTLTVGNAHIILLDETGKETMTVTLIDANHCPGATMFLFEGYFGRFLYTGDFRYHPHIFADTVLGLNRSVDRLYLDNTYNSPENDFPGEDDCKVKIMEVLAEYPYTNVVLGMHHLGKENLLVDIADCYGENIQVTPERLSMIKLLDCKDVFTTSESRIRVVPVHTITMGAVEKWNSEFPTIVVIPSAIFRSQRKSCITSHPNVFIIPYSSHSSYSELIQFVKQVRPRKVIPIVQPTHSKTSEAAIAIMSNFDHYLDSTPPTAVSIPSSVQTYMNSNLVVGELKRSSLRKRNSITDNRGISKIAKGVVFKDVSDDDSDSHQNMRENSTDNGCAKELEAEKKEENPAVSIWDVRTCSETSEMFEKFDQCKGELTLQVGEKSKNMPQDEDFDKDTQRNEHKQDCTPWQVCHETFYTKRKYIRRSPRKKSQHICNHAQSGKSCLCKFLVIKETKVNKENKTSFPGQDKWPCSSRTDETKDDANEPVFDQGKDVTTNASTDDEQCPSSDGASVKMCRNTDLHKGTCRHKRVAPSISSVDPRSKKDCHVRCYSAIQNFYKRVKTCSIESTLG